MNNGPAEIVTIAACVVVLAADVTFIVLNHMWTAWRSNAWGRHVMLFSYVLAILLTLALARLVFGDYPGRRPLITVFYVALAGVMCQRVQLVIREHRRQRR